MKRLLITLTAAMLVASGLWAKDDEVIVTHQLTSGQRNALPEKTISIDMKGLIFNKKADAGLVNAIIQVMDTIAQEDYQNRTFVLLFEVKNDGTISITAHSDDILTHGTQTQGLYYGSLEHNRYHFAVLADKANEPLFEKTFKRQGKVKYVQEFEFVDFKTPLYPTNVIGQWSPQDGFKWLTVIINEDPSNDRDSFDRPATVEN